MTAYSHRLPDRVRGIPSYESYLACDGRDVTGNHTVCPRRINGRAAETRPIARAAGWLVGPPKDYCPDCRKDRL